MTKRSQWLDRTVLHGVHLALCVNEKQYLKANKHLGVKDPLPWLSNGTQTQGAATHTLSNDKAGTIACIVCVAPNKKRSRNILASILAHEAIHVAQEMYGYIGETRPGKEIEAYVIQNLVHTLLDAYDHLT
jgi:hypothetical protein